MAIVFLVLLGDFVAKARKTKNRQNWSFELSFRLCNKNWQSVDRGVVRRTWPILRVLQTWYLEFSSPLKLRWACAPGHGGNFRHFSEMWPMSFRSLALSLSASGTKKRRWDERTKWPTDKTSTRTTRQSQGLFQLQLNNDTMKTSATRERQWKTFNKRCATNRLSGQGTLSSETKPLKPNEIVLSALSFPALPAWPRTWWTAMWDLPLDRKSRSLHLLAKAMFQQPWATPRATRATCFESYRMRTRSTKRDEKFGSSEGFSKASELNGVIAARRCS